MIMNLHHHQVSSLIGYMSQSVLLLFMFGNITEIILALLALISIVALAFVYQYNTIVIDERPGYMCVTLVLNNETICYK